MGPQLSGEGGIDQAGSPGLLRGPAKEGPDGVPEPDVARAGGAEAPSGE